MHYIAFLVSFPLQEGLGVFSVIFLLHVICLIFSREDGSGFPFFLLFPSLALHRCSPYDKTKLLSS